MSGWGNVMSLRFAENYNNHYADKSKPQTLMEREVAKLGIPYQAQFPFYNLQAVVDFRIPDLGLLLELDGKEHRQPKKAAADRLRDDKLKARGWYTVRIPNQKVLEDPAAALAWALKELERKKKEDEEC